jgi:hypothetical protein
MDSTGFENWTENKGGWEKITDSMSNQEVQACAPAGVTFVVVRKSAEITEMELSNSGLEGAWAHGGYTVIIEI